MTLLYEAAGDLQRFCSERGWRCCFIGGVAVQRWGDPRVTRDADLTLLTGFGDEERYVDALASEYELRHENARDLALTRRVLLLRHSNGVPLDVALGALPFEIESVDRSSEWEFSPGKYLRTCSAEDLVVHKAFASRTQDWADIERVLMRHAGKLNTSQILRELIPLVELKEEPEIVERLVKLIDRWKK